VTISSATNTAGPFAGNGSATAFPFAFKVFSRPELVFEVTDAAGTVSAKTLDSDFSVSLNADQDANPGGTITYPISGAPLATGETAIISTDLPYTQLTDITNAGGFLPQVIEDALDRNVRLMQQQAERTARSVRAPLGESMANLPPAAERANMLLTFDEDGDPVAVAPASQSATDLQILLTSTATGNGTAMLGDSDVGGYYTGTNQAAINQEIGAALGWRYAADIRKYGAVAGGPDCTAAYNLARATGAPVYIPPGEWFMNVTETAGELVVIGAGQENSIITAFNAANPVFDLDGRAALLNFFTFKDLTISGVSRTGDGIRIRGAIIGPGVEYGCDNITMENVFVKRCRYGFNAEGRSIWNTFKHCEFVANFDGVHVESNDQACNAWNFYGGKISGNYRHGFYGHKAVVSVSGYISFNFWGVNFEYNGQDTAQAIACGAYFSNFEGITIHGGHIENNGYSLASGDGYGLYFGGSLCRAIDVRPMWAVGSQYPIYVTGAKKSGLIDCIGHASADYKPAGTILTGAAVVTISSTWSDNEPKIELGETLNCSVLVVNDVNSNSPVSHGFNYIGAPSGSLDMKNYKKATINVAAGSVTISTISNVQSGQEIVIANRGGGTANTVTVAAGLMCDGVAVTIPANKCAKLVKAGFPFTTTFMQI
jgi:hypothetical protein